jgi:NADP-dependent 3-hydroxy acid dehydrogenase YdfG
MASELEGKVAAITGATSGIGEATARVLARAGAAVALAGRREDRLTELAERIAADGGRAETFPTDVTDEGQATAFVEGAAERLGGLDILVNNAGVMLLGAVEGADTSEWRQMIEVNLLGLLYCTHAGLPLLRERGGGTIVNVSSVAGRQANLGSAVYNMTKFGVHAFSEALRQEALHAGIRVVIVAPGMVATELVSHNKNPAVLEAAKKMRDEVGTPLSAEDIADGILFAVTQPDHVAINELLVRPTGQRR